MKSWELKIQTKTLWKTQTYYGRAVLSLKSQIATKGMSFEKVIIAEVPALSIRVSSLFPGRPAQAAACHPRDQPTMPLADTSQPSKVQGLLVADSCQSSKPKSLCHTPMKMLKCEMPNAPSYRSEIHVASGTSVLFRKPYRTITNIFPKQWRYLSMPFIMQWLTDLLILSRLCLFHTRKWKMWIPVVQLLCQI